MLSGRLSTLRVALGERDRLFQAALALIVAGVVLRIAFWWLYPPIYKLHAVFTPLEMSALVYLSDFESYMAVRMPFYDVLAAAFYVPTAWLFGVKATKIFALVVSAASLPFFYGAVARLFDRRVGLGALVLFALYPKMLVLTGQGFPEAASAGFIAVSLYGLARGRDTASLGWYAIGGGFAMLAYLMFIPSVAYGVLATVYLYLTERDGRPSRLADLVPRPRTWVFSLPPGVMGLAYLRYGPLNDAVGVVTGEWSNMAVPLFDVGTYPLAERVVRYLLYVYFDFWWHFRGYDKEGGILRTVTSLQQFLGDAFYPYAAGWFLLTGLLTVAVLYGIVRLAEKREATATFVLAWLFLYVVLFNVRNSGWTGIFQTRHVFSIFPAVCVAFGAGSVALVDRYGESLSAVTGRVLPDRLAVPDLAAIVTVVVFGILIVNGAAEGVIIAENHRLSKAEPVDELERIAGEDGTVAVATRWDYWDVVLYSEGAVRPVLLAPTAADRALFERWTVLADIRVVDESAVASTRVDYFYAAHCGEYRPRQQRYRTAILAEGVTPVHEQTLERGAGRCTVRVSVLPIAGGGSR